MSWGGCFTVLGSKFFLGEPFRVADSIFAFLTMLLGPSLGGVLLTRFFDGKTGSRALFDRMRRWKVGFRWYLTAVLTFPVLIAAVLMTLSRVVSNEFTPSLMAFGLVYGLLAGFFEEIGWMGFAYPKMRLKYSVLTTSLILGLLHGVWHIAADFLGASQTLGRYWLLHFVLMWGFAMVALRMMIAWIYENTKSLLLAQLAHASSTGFLIVLSPSPITPAGETLWYGVYGLVLWALALLLLAKDKSLFLSSANGDAS
jgi:membrane protease YdiL (CAAX protease family)